MIGIKFEGVAWFTDNKSLLRLVWKGASTPQSSLYPLNLPGKGQWGFVRAVSRNGERLLCMDPYSTPPGDIYVAVGALDGKALPTRHSLNRTLNQAPVCSPTGRFAYLRYGQPEYQRIFDLFRERDYPLEARWDLVSIHDDSNGNCILLGCRGMGETRPIDPFAGLGFLWLRIDRTGAVVKREGTADDLKTRIGEVFLKAATAAFDRRYNPDSRSMTPNQFLLSPSGSCALIQGLVVRGQSYATDTLTPRDRLIYRLWLGNQYLWRTVLPTQYVTFAAWLKDDRHLVGQQGVELDVGSPADGYPMTNFVIVAARSGKAVYSHLIPSGFRMIAFYES